MKATSFVSPPARVAQPRVNAGLDLVDELKCRRAAKSSLRDDRLSRRFAGQQEGRDARWHGIRNIPDARFSDWTRTARHSRHEAERRRAHLHRERGFFLGRNATDLNPGRDGEHI
jgi:hypothetical protein